MKVLALVLVGLIVLTYGCVSTQPTAPRMCSCPCPPNSTANPSPVYSIFSPPVICNCPNCPANTTQTLRNGSTSSGGLIPPPVQGSANRPPVLSNGSPIIATPVPSGPANASSPPVKPSNLSNTSLPAPLVPTTSNGITETMCDSAHGSWNDCGSACRGAPEGTVCPMYCVAYCGCASSSDCPGGYRCGDYLPLNSDGTPVANATGICEKNSSN